MLPKDLPPWQDVYAHFRRWTQRNLFETMHDRLRAMWRLRQGRQPASTAAVLDSQFVKTSAQGGPKGYDAGKKVKGRKRHLVVEVLGILLAVLVLPAEVQDRDGAQPVVHRGDAQVPHAPKDVRGWQKQRSVRRAAANAVQARGGGRSQAGPRGNARLAGSGRFSVL